MPDLSRPLMSQLHAATSFEDAATATLRALLTVAEQTLAQSRWARSGGRMLRGMVHLRPGGGYRGLVVLESGARVVSTPGGDAALMPSATAWRWVEAHRAGVAVDVNAGRLTPVGGESVTAPILQTGETLDSNATIRRFLHRDATHVFVLPLRAPGDGLVGLISLEANCLPAIEDPFIWPAAAEELQFLTDLAAAYLVGLPPQPHTLMRDDPLLPVVGGAMSGLISLLEVFARQEETLLISGPTGAGKSRLAAWCHAASNRRDGPFQVVDLLTVPEDMQMAELFGWRRGAFTGALRDQDGCVARANKGTLFIDEIDKLSLKAQSGLLQLLERRTYRVLGDPGSEQRADVRFVVGTNADLAASVAQGRFREDLYYRINVLPVRLPPLDERADEIPGWASFMLQRRHSEAMPRGRASLSADASLLLVRRRWPGNLRQLDNVVRRAYAVALAEAGAVPETLTMDRRHVERALAFDADGEPAGLLPALQRAARTFADALLSPEGEGAGSLDLNHSEAFRGLVLAEGVNRVGDLKDLYLKLGQQRLVEGRNHTQSFRRDLRKVADLYAALGEVLEPGWARLLGDG